MKVALSILADFLAKHRGGKVTQRLNSVYATEEGRLEPAVRRLQRRSLDWLTSCRSAASGESATRPGPDRARSWHNIRAARHLQRLLC
jgi:hypothetical protein